MPASSLLPDLRDSLRTALIPQIEGTKAVGIIALPGAMVGLILAGGISAWFGVQAIINMGGVVGLMPVTGLTLPFFSAGGTSLFVSMVAAGLLLNVARRVVTAPADGRRSAASKATRSARSR